MCDNPYFYRSQSPPAVNPVVQYDGVLQHYQKLLMQPRPIESNYEGLYRFKTSSPPHQTFQTQLPLDRPSSPPTIQFQPLDHIPSHYIYRPISPTPQPTIQLPFNTLSSTTAIQLPRPLSPSFQTHFQSQQISPNRPLSPQMPLRTTQTQLPLTSSIPAFQPHFQPQQQSPNRQSTPQVPRPTQTQLPLTSSIPNFQPLYQLSPSHTRPSQTASLPINQVYPSQPLTQLTSFPKTYNTDQAPYGAIIIDIEHAILQPPRAWTNRTRDAHIELFLGYIDCNESRIVGRTNRVDNNNSPEFNEHKVLWLGYENYRALKLVVVDNTALGREIVGELIISIENLMFKKDIQDSEAKLIHPKENNAVGTISYKAMYRSNKDLGMEDRYEVRSLKGYVDNIYPVRSNGFVKLFQDTHVGHHHAIEKIPDHKPGNNWEETYMAMSDAKVFIYIIGWYIDINQKLVRERDLQGYEGLGHLTLGELLKRKADQGVKVLLMIWQPPQDYLGLGFVVGVWPKEVVDYFKGSKVEVLNAMRTHPHYVKWVAHTHHQKGYVMDGPTKDPNKRKLVAFLGGIDLCAARYDTPHHYLWKSLLTTHKDDFHNNCAPRDFSINGVGGLASVSQEFGPREPWHDLQLRFEGDSAADFLYMFARRWVLQSSDDKQHLVYLDVEPFSSIINPTRIETPLPWLERPLKDGWNTQLFLSADGYVCKDLEIDNKVDSSIHLAYIHQIRRAQKFIYIENQFFVSSAQYWDDLVHDVDRAMASELMNHIAAEITIKIVHKIRNRERFAAYILVPAYPEENPANPGVQQLLIFQHSTVAFMYKRIAQELKEVGSNDHPTDYLNFYCLGNRELECDASPRPNKSPRKGGFQEKVLKTRRFVVYVHSKMMLVDDTYVIMGSANINERSMNGSRDSEVCLGSWQPQYVIDNNGKLPRGDVHRYRMSLWAEHTNTFEEIFYKPESRECVRRINQLAERNWQLFTQEQPCDLPGHLLKYPYEVGLDGSVKARIKYWPDMEDVGAYVFNSHQPTDILKTLIGPWMPASWISYSG